MRPKQNPMPLAGGNRASLGFAEQRPSTRFFPEAQQGDHGKPHMRLVSFKPLLKGTLRGFAHIELPIGLCITDCPVLVSNGKAWATPPSKPVLDRDGRHVEVNGKRQYAPILEWRDRDLADRFGAAVVALVREAHPDALDGGAP
jgi:hypothetical protein